MRTLRLTKSSAGDVLDGLLKRSPNNYTAYEASVAEIVADVRERGDAALFEYTKRFDKADINAENIRVTPEEIREAYELVDEKLLGVIRRSMANIRAYHEKQKRYGWFDTTPDGTILGQRVTPLGSAGIYVPGGKAAYPSSVLMNTIPAQVAGVPRIVMVTPPGKDGKVNPTTPVAA